MNDTLSFIFMLMILAVGVLIVAPILGIGSGYVNLAVKTVSADNWQNNYEWFKTQETSIQQIQNQVCSVDNQITDYKSTYGNVSTWTKSTKDGYNDLQFVKNGYISKYNSLVAEYNTRRASLIKSFGRDPQAPKDMEPFIGC